jgi:hypothetical protein
MSRRNNDAMRLSTKTDLVIRIDLGSGAYALNKGILF